MEQSITDIKMIVLKKYMQVGKGFLTDEKMKNAAKRSAVVGAIIIRINNGLEKLIGLVHRVWVLEKFVVGVDGHLVAFDAVLEAVDVEVETCGVLSAHGTSEIAVVFDIPMDEGREGRKDKRMVMKKPTKHQSRRGNSY